jgi:hypothetical protein
MFLLFGGREYTSGFEVLTAVIVTEYRLPGRDAMSFRSSLQTFRSNVVKKHLDVCLSFRPMLHQISTFQSNNILNTISARSCRGYKYFTLQKPGALSLRVKRPGREADHSPLTNAEVKKMWIYTSTPPYIFMA